MSRRLVLLGLVAQSGSAEWPAASVLEEREPSVIDPVDGRLDKGISVASDSSAHPLVGITIGLAASILDDWSGAIAPGLSTRPTQAEPSRAPC